MDFFVPTIPATGMEDRRMRLNTLRLAAETFEEERVLGILYDALKSGGTILVRTRNQQVKWKVVRTVEESSHDAE